MPTHFGKDADGCFAQWGSQAKYHYKCGNAQAKAAAKAKADKQGRAAYAGGYRGERDQLMEPKVIDIENLVIIDLKASRIDKENNIISHVPFLTNEAFDTSGNVFRKFTDGALNDSVEIFENALARVDHDRENQSVVESRGVRSSFGVYQNIRREGNTVYGDLHLWDCESARKVMSIAERTPHAVGNSIHAGGKMREDEDGVEVIERIMPRTSYGHKPSIDLVDDPAATISLLQNKRDKSKSNKETEMKFEDLTQDTIRTNRPDLEKIFFDEGVKSRDKEVKNITQERDDAVKKADELEVKQAQTERELLADKVIAESDLPDYARTDVFRKQLMQVKEAKDGDRIITIEQGMKALIDDRISTLDPDGIHDSDEKDVSQNKGKSNTKNFSTVFGASKSGFVE